MSAYDPKRTSGASRDHAAPDGTRQPPSQLGKADD
jgi:hypothetical protein